MVTTTRREDGTWYECEDCGMLFDEEAAYVGSANVTDYGFDRYLELGVLLRGPPVTRYRRLLESLLSSDASREIQL